MSKEVEVSYGLHKCPESHLKDAKAIIEHAILMLGHRESSTIAKWIEQARDEITAARNKFPLSAIAKEGDRWAMSVKEQDQKQ